MLSFENNPIHTLCGFAQLSQTNALDTRQNNVSTHEASDNKGRIIHKNVESQIKRLHFLKRHIVAKF